MTKERRLVRIGVVIPALNESQAVAAVIAELRDHTPAGDELRVVVCDNNSTDNTATIARQAGAEVVAEPQRGYGAACLRALKHLGDWPEVVVFADADGSADLERLPELINPIRRGQTDGVIGRRQFVEPGSMTLPQRLGTALFCTLVQWRWRVPCRDLGPLRAISRSALERLGMTDTTWGWTLEMQIKAILDGLRIAEVPVRWRRRRGGASKISGTLAGTLRACGKITWTFGWYAPRCRRQAPPPLDRVIEFVKYPQPGAVKTRLAATVGANHAAWIYRRLAGQTHRRLCDLQSDGLIDLTVFGTGATCADMRHWLPGANRYQPQPGGDLSTRLRTAFEQAFADGAPRVAAVGSDNPDLDGPRVSAALDRLQEADAAVIPNTDGGYALIALRRYLPQLFDGIDWSSSRVLEQTRGQARRCGIRLAELPAIPDVDRAEDLQHIPPLLSVVIPALNEQDTLSTNLPELLRQIACSGIEVPVVVVDGGSQDHTTRVAAECGARVISAPRGRGTQMNAGSHLTASSWLWFMHADCRVPPGAVRALLETLSRETQRCWGYFEPRVEAAGMAYRVIDAGIGLRSRLLHLPLGDQGLFVHRDAFTACAQYAEHGVLEDADLVRKLSGLSRPIRMPLRLAINPRRWRKNGLWRTTNNNWSILLRYCVRGNASDEGVSDYNSSGNPLPDEAALEKGAVL